MVTHITCAFSCGASVGVRLFHLAEAVTLLRESEALLKYLDSQVMSTLRRSKKDVIFIGQT